MVGRATTLVLYLGWPCVLAVVIGLAGIELGQGALPLGRRLSVAAYGKFEALSVCVQSVTGERHEAEAGRALVAGVLDGLTVNGQRQYTLPAVVDVMCPGVAAHYGSGSDKRRVANRGGSTRPSPSPYQLHVFLMPRVSLMMLHLEPDLGDRRVLIEEYTISGVDSEAKMTGVTYGLYTTLDELSNAATVRRFFDHTLEMQSQLGARPERF
jgi:hypothetical protein